MEEMIGVGDLRFGDTLYHPRVGKFTLLGFSPHCGDYAIDYVTDGGDKGWCYLKNCRYV
jgi:hypothetical protein